MNVYQVVRHVIPVLQHEVVSPDFPINYKTFSKTFLLIFSNFLYLLIFQTRVNYCGTLKNHHIWKEFRKQTKISFGFPFKKWIASAFISLRKCCKKDCIFRSRISFFVKKERPKLTFKSGTLTIYFDQTILIYVPKHHFMEQHFVHSSDQQQTHVQYQLCPKVNCGTVSEISFPLLAWLSIKACQTPIP